MTDPLIDDEQRPLGDLGGGAQRTSDPADVIVDIGTLSTAYMGGVAWRDLAASALLPVDAEPDHARHCLDALFAVRPDRLLRHRSSEFITGPEKTPSVTLSVRAR